ncbi:ATP-binding protein [uncultured Paracoccus sp.]|uniref:ATP-binding protein n=1 Tax=uncultured Paracoccus sp. TaxID=189685 RepID=UPI0025E107DC|nr:ATP-binding protein [uncultured Paracoccus sp.]
MSSIERQNADLTPRPLARSQPMFHRVLQADPHAVRRTLKDLRTRFAPQISPDTMGRLELVLAEVMNNVAEHADLAQLPKGGSRSIHLCVVMHDNGLSCAITDDGGQLPADCLLPRSLPAMDPLDLPEGGFGWFLIQGLTQSLCYYREDQRNCLAFMVPYQQSQFSGPISG